MAEFVNNHIQNPESHEWLQSNQRKEQQQQLQNNLHQLSALFNNSGASFFHFQVADTVPSSPPTPNNSFLQPQQSHSLQSHSQYQQQQQQQHHYQIPPTQHSSFGAAVGSRSGLGQNSQVIGVRSAPQPPIGPYQTNQQKFSAQPFYPSHSKQTPPNSFNDYDHPSPSQHSYTPPIMSPLVSPPVIDHYFNQPTPPHEQQTTVQQQYHQYQIQLQIQQQKERQEKQNQQSQIQSQLKPQPQIKAPTDNFLGKSQLQSQLQTQQALSTQLQLQPQQASPQGESFLTKSPSSPNQSRLKATSPVTSRRASLGSEQAISARPNHFGNLPPQNPQSVSLFLVDLRVIMFLFNGGFNSGRPQCNDYLLNFPHTNNLNKHLHCQRPLLSRFRSYHLKALQTVLQEWAGKLTKQHMIRYNSNAYY